MSQVIQDQKARHLLEGMLRKRNDVFEFHLESSTQPPYETARIIFVSGESITVQGDTVEQAVNAILRRLDQNDSADSEDDKKSL